MILNDVEIRKRVNNYKELDMIQPMIAPFCERQLQGASYDVTLDDEIICLRSIDSLLDTKNQTILDSVYERKTMDDRGFLLMPHVYTLITLRETLYIPPVLTAHIRPKTRFIRLGLLVTGQHINPDSVCKLNLGVCNLTCNPILLYPGMSIAQVVFEEMKSPPSDEKLYRTKKDTNYSEDIDFVGAKFKNEFSKYINAEVDRLLE